MLKYARTKEEKQRLSHEISFMGKIPGTPVRMGTAVVDLRMLQEFLKGLDRYEMLVDGSQLVINYDTGRAALCGYTSEHLAALGDMPLPTFEV